MSKYSEVVMSIISRLDDPSELTDSDKVFILRLLNGELRKDRYREEQRAATAKSGSKWTDEDVAALKSLLGNRRAKSYEEGKANLAEATALMKRSKQSVKNKCLEIGLGDAIDFIGQGLREFIQSQQLPDP